MRSAARLVAVAGLSLETVRDANPLPLVIHTDTSLGAWVGRVSRIEYRPASRNIGAQNSRVRPRVGSDI